MRIPLDLWSICRPRQYLVFPKTFISNSSFKYVVAFVSSLEVPNKFISSTNTERIANPNYDFFIKTQGHIGLLIYPSLIKYSLKRLYHILPDCFKPYNDRLNLIEYIFRGCDVF